MSLFPRFDPDLDSTPSAIPAIAAIPSTPNSGNSGNSSDPVPVPTPAEAASMRLSQIEEAGLALLVKVKDGFMVWASTKARIPEEWAGYPIITTEELRQIPPGNMQAARDSLALKRAFPGSTLHPVSATATPTTLSAPAPVTCGTCKHFQAATAGGLGDCPMHQDQRTTAPSERYPAGYPIQPALYPNAKREWEFWEAL